MTKLPDSFTTYKTQGHKWITLATGEYYPDILADACKLYQPVLEMFGQIVNPEMLSQIIQASSNPDDIVLDCFCGSGTTLDEASRLERQWISPTALDTILHRFAKGLEPMGDFVNGQPKANQPPLFDAMQPDMITNLSLYASEPYQGELDKLLRQWKEWQ